jgi:hypothetical protein
MFADGTSVIISRKNLDDFCMLSNRAVSLMSKWFAANKLTLNLDKTNRIKFTTINLPQCPLSIEYDDKYIEESVHTKFLGLCIDNYLNWRNHIDQLNPKLNGTCYAVRSLLHISNTGILKSIYHACFHSLMKYGIIFWGNSTDSKKVFTLQKKIIRIMLGVKPQNSCRGLFKRLQILPLPCEYIFSLLNFIMNNQEHFQTNSAVHSVNTRNKHHLHRPAANLTCFQKNTYFGIKIFNNLPSSLKRLMNEKAKFKVALKRYLNTHSFYSVDEFLMSKTVSSS